MKEEVKEKVNGVEGVVNPQVKRRGFFGYIVIFFIGVLVVIILGASGVLTYVEVYKDKVYPGVYIGRFSLGAMTRAEVEDFVENFNNKITKEGLTVNYTDNASEKKSLNLSVLSVGDSTVELVRLDSKNLADQAFNIGRNKNFWENLSVIILMRWQEIKLLAEVRIEKEFKDTLKEKLDAMGDSPQDASISIVSIKPLSYNINPEKNGSYLDGDQVIKDISNLVSQMNLAAVEVFRKDFYPEIVSADLNFVSSSLPAILAVGDINLSYIDPQTKVEKTWKVGVENYRSWVEVRESNAIFVLALNKEKVVEYLQTLHVYTDVAAKDAKFSVVDGRVQEFQASQRGVSMDDDKTYLDIDSVFRDRNFSATPTLKTINISLKIVEPNVEMGNANLLGIKDIIGVGVSTFKDSHTNRIKNIANAVKRLNGTLIKPGEDFSTTKYAGPFVLENGFLLEEVIKGNEIKKEVGGGMCQIGTTLFRMAMNAGMPITERRNHSLVVGYYADPVNGNPGTDATIYEPIIDFRFLNDTGNYLLLQTAIDYKKQQLTFTLWGVSDGRSGSYTHPLVSKWIPAGDQQKIVVDTLKPGEEKCQNAFRGAVASFTYTRVTSSSEKISRVFDSYYRPLSKICMVGATSSPLMSVTSSIQSEAIATSSAIETLVE